MRILQPVDPQRAASASGAKAPLRDFATLRALATVELCERAWRDLRRAPLERLRQIVVRRRRRAPGRPGGLQPGIHPAGDGRRKFALAQTRWRRFGDRLICIPGKPRPLIALAGTRTGCYVYTYFPPIMLVLNGRKRFWNSLWLFLTRRAGVLRVLEVLAEESASSAKKGLNIRRFWPAESADAGSQAFVCPVFDCLSPHLPAPASYVCERIFGKCAIVVIFARTSPTWYLVQ